MKEFCPYCQNDPVTHMQQKEICGVCEMETEVAKRKMTNADRIRSMSDEELAKWLVRVEVQILRVQPMLERFALEKDWLEWLQKECE